VLDLVLPKGSLEQQTLKLFEDADLPLKRRGDREYNATIDDPRIGQVKILRPQEISKYVEQGYFDLGVTGQDWIMENDSHVVDIMNLGYSKQGTNNGVKIVLAVAQESGIQKPHEIPPGSRISTEYPVLTRRYFEKLGIPVEVHLSYGATEAKVPEIADGIVDVTETGATLIKHGMRIIDMAPVLVGDGVQLVDSTTDVSLSNLHLVDNDRVGLLLDVGTGSTAGVRLSAITVSGTGTALGAIAQGTTVVAGWDGPIVREGATATNDPVFTGVLEKAGAISPTDLPRAEELRAMGLAAIDGL